MRADGYIKLHRQVMENEFYFSERFTKMAAWVDLLLLARHSTKPAFVSIRGNMVEVHRGELCYSILSLSKRWRWNRRTVLNFLSHLSNREMIHYRTSRLTTVIAILKYDEYQQSTQQSAQQSSNRLHTNKNVKKEEARGTPNEMQSLITFFCLKHLELRKSRYAVQYGKDQVAAKSMLESLGLEECKTRAVRYLSRQDKYCDEHGYTLHNMAQVINGLAGGNGQETGFEASQREAKELQRINREKACQN